MKSTIAQIWDGFDDGDFVIKDFGYALANLKNREAFLATLQPENDNQKAAKADAFQASLAIGQTRTQLALGLVDPVSYPLLGTVVAWAAFLFCGYGLLSRRPRPTSRIVRRAPPGVLTRLAAPIAKVNSIRAPLSETREARVSR
jgi:hypothetical protein